jgi:endonuclease/exonuclease/phosphatase family metal-dependent hydrolase
MRALPRTLRASLHVLTAALAFASACSDLSAPSSDPQVLPRPAADPPGAKRITVYTQNLYVGADVDAVIAALASGDQAAALDALSHAVATLHRTSFEARAAAIADEIARVRPDVVGFQEGSKIDVDLTPLGAPIVAHEDFLVTLRNALAARGLSGYAVADTITNIQASLLSGLVSLTDYDIMLVNTERVTVGSTFKKNFAENDGPFAGIDLIRGFIGAEITVEGRGYVVVTTHTEGTDLTPLVDYHQLHASQMQEIVDRVSLLDLPAIVMGDLNDSEVSPMYSVMRDAGFADAWRTLRPGGEGNTCCHLSDLSDSGPPAGTFDQRIDYVFARGFGVVGRDLHGQITRYGVLKPDQLTGPDGTLWPSDHAGLVATLVAPAAIGAAR